MGTERERLLSKTIDWILPPSIIVYTVWGLHMSVFHIGIGWIGCHEESPKYSIAHIVFSIIAVSVIIGLILFLWTLPLDHDVPPRIEHAIAQKWFDQYPRECFDKAGVLSVCDRGQCGGRIKPPRTHHCSVCQRCRMGWDHHCPWVGSCLTIHQSKAFLTLLVITAFSTCIMALPIIGPTLDGAHAMYLVSRSHPGCNRLWWDWWGSYIVFGGPGGRWVLGTALGYWVAKPQVPVNPRMCRYGLPYMRPTMNAVLTLTIALSLAVFCLVLASRMAFHLLRGQTTIEALQTAALRGRGDTPRRFLWLPSPAHPQVTDPSLQVAPVGIEVPIEGIRHRTPLSSDLLRTRGSVVSLDPNARIYDLGIWRNAKTTWNKPIFSPRSPPRTLREPPEINPDIIKRINKTGT